MNNKDRNKLLEDLLSLEDKCQGSFAQKTKKPIKSDPKK